MGLSDWKLYINFENLNKKSQAFTNILIYKSKNSWIMSTILEDDVSGVQVVILGT